MLSSGNSDGSTAGRGGGGAYLLCQAGGRLCIDIDFGEQPGPESEPGPSKDAPKGASDGADVPDTTNVRSSRDMTISSTSPRAQSLLAAVTRIGVPGGPAGPTGLSDYGRTYAGGSPATNFDMRSGMGMLAGPTPRRCVGDCNSLLNRALDWFLPPSDPMVSMGVIWIPGLPMGATAARGLGLVAKNGSKLSQQIARWRAIGGQGGAQEFLRYAGKLGAEARAAGQSVTGTVGKGAQALQNATIYRRGTEYLVVQGNTIMSYVSQATSGGIVDEFIRLGGKL